MFLALNEMFLTILTSHSSRSTTGIKVNVVDCTLKISTKVTYIYRNTKTMILTLLNRTSIEMAYFYVEIL